MSNPMPLSVIVTFSVSETDFKLHGDAVGFGMLLTTLLRASCTMRNKKILVRGNRICLIARDGELASSYGIGSQKT